MLNEVSEIQVRINGNLSIIALRYSYGWTVEDHTAVPKSEIVTSTDLLEKFIILLDFLTTVEVNRETFPGTERDVPSDLLKIEIQ